MLTRVIVSVVMAGIVLSLFFGTSVHAGSPEHEPSIFDGFLEGFDPDKYTDEAGRRLSWWERSVANTMWWFLRAVVQVFRLEPIETLIFKRPMRLFYNPYIVPDPQYLVSRAPPKFFQGHHAPEIGGLFYEDEWQNIIRPPFEVFRNIAFALVAISVVFSGFKIALKAGNPVGRAESKEHMLNLFITAVAIGMMLVGAIFIMDMNVGLVAAIEQGIDEGLVSRFGEGESTLVTLRLTETLRTGSWFFTFFAYCYLVFLTLFFNVLYLMRKFIIMVLIIVGPVVVWAWGRGHQTSLYLWLSEFISNVFMQSAHALVFLLYFNIASTVTVGFMGSPFGRALLLLMLVPVSLLLRKLIAGWFNLIGLDEERTARGLLGGLFGGAAAFVGIGSGVTRALKGIGGGGGPSGGDTHAPDEPAGGRGGVLGAVSAGAAGASAGGAIGASFGPTGVAAGSAIGAGAGALGSVGMDAGKAAAAPVGEALEVGNRSLDTGAQPAGFTFPASRGGPDGDGASFDNRLSGGASAVNSPAGQSLSLDTDE